MNPCRVLIKHINSIKKTLYALMAISVLFFSTLPNLSPPAFAETAAAIPDKIVLQLRWEHQFQFAGYYAALWEGYYDDAGLDVEIRPGIDTKGNVILAPQAVENGQADFGVGGVDILLAVDSGLDLRVVSTIFQRSPVAYYLMPDTSFKSIYDFTRLNVARREHDLLDIELQAMLINEGIDPEHIASIPKDVVLSFEDLKNGTYDVIPGYLDTISYQANQQGYTLRKISPLDFGIDFYGDSLFTSEDLAKSRPKLVERFRKATLEGWAYALENPEEMAQRIADHFYADAPDYEEYVAFNKFQAKQVLDLTLYPVVEIGNMNPFRWTHMIDYLTELHLIQRPIDTNTLLFDYRKIEQEKSYFYIRLYQSLLAVIAIGSLFGYILHMNRKTLKLQSEIEFRKEAEQKISLSHERYQRMFDSSFLGITVTDRHGRILQANSKWAEMTGYTQDQLLEMSIFDILSPESISAGKRYFKKLRDGVVTEIGMERLYRRKDKSEFWGQLYMTSVKDPETLSVNFLGMVHDITERKHQREAAERAEKRFMRIVKELTSEMEAIKPDGAFIEQLEQINLELERLYKRELKDNRKKEALIIHQARQAAMGEMVGNIAHQWRQPLNNLGLIITNLMDAYRFDELDDVLMDETCNRARLLIRQMSETIDDFQDFLKPSVNSERFEVEQTLDIVVELLKDNLKFNKITLRRMDCADLALRGQKNQLAQAIFNILSNAVDAIRENQPDNRELLIETSLKTPDHIEATLSPEPLTDQKYVMIEITDHAGGIPEKVIDKIFDPYFTTKSKEEGTGLGLYITKSIIENSFNGFVDFQMTETGTKFTITLPIEE